MFVMTKSFSSKHITKPDRRTVLWLCAAAEVSLAEQKETGDSVVLFVVSSTASQFHCTVACYFELFNSKRLKYINFLRKEKLTIFNDVPLLGSLNTWLNDDGVGKIIIKIII